MRTAAPALFPLFRSSLQSRLLTRILLGDGEESVADLAGAIDADPGNTAREVARLELAGIVISRRIGRNKLIRANRQAPYYGPLVELVTIVLGPAQVLAHELTVVGGIRLAEIFGCWADRYHEEPGGSPSEVDLLVVGSPDRDNLYAAIAAASRRLRRIVNPVVVSAQRWDDTGDAFVRELRSRPRVPVLSTELAAVAGAVAA